MDEKKIRDLLVERGRQLFDAPREPVRFTGDAKADALLDDLEQYPHAFVLACVMDRQIKAEKAWIIPYRVQQKLGNLSMTTLSALSKSKVRLLMTKPEPLHWLVNDMSRFFFAAVRRIVDEYDGDAASIWRGEPSSADVVYRFLAFDGVGPKIANMAANILARRFKIRFSDYYSIDISADAHVRRVFGRLGLTSPDATPEQLVYRARALHPDFPGLMDFATWEIGRSWCKPRDPECSRCYVREVCKAVEGKSRRDTGSDRV